MIGLFRQNYLCLNSNLQPPIDLVLSPLVDTFVIVGRTFIIIGLLALVSLQIFPLQGFGQFHSVQNNEQLEIKYFPIDEESNENESKEGGSEEDTNKIKKIELTNDVNIIDIASQFGIKKNMSFRTIGATKEFHPEMVIPPPNEMLQRIILDNMHIHSFRFLQSWDRQLTTEKHFNEIRNNKQRIYF